MGLFDALKKKPQRVVYVPGPGERDCLGCDWCDTRKCDEKGWFFCAMDDEYYFPSVANICEYYKKR